MPDGEKMLGLRFLKADIDMVHAASYDCDARLDLMDRMGITWNRVSKCWWLWQPELLASPR